MNEVIEMNETLQEVMFRIADTVSGYWYYDTDEQDYVFVPSAENLE